MEAHNGNTRLPGADMPLVVKCASVFRITQQTGSVICSDAILHHCEQLLQLLAQHGKQGAPMATSCYVRNCSRMDSGILDAVP